MDAAHQTRKKNEWLIYFVLFICGPIILFLISLIQRVPSPETGEYNISLFLRNNYTFLAATLFFITGFSAGYFFKANPWLIGLCLIMAFPLTSILEAIIYKGSHNLIPFEFLVFIVFALPSVAAAYIGLYLNKQLSKKETSE